ncbi:MAG: 2Fe-2S iron-sulfur cluster binding domain-containing protein [Pseudomonadota bacterium]|nr:2Fe-2S iron-sulfur cluster binding domain-containing protein [Pseudomonadota bacterium]
MMADQRPDTANCGLTLITDHGAQAATGAPTTTLLEAMRNAGLPVRKACRNGVCGLCRCRLLSGEITYHWKEPHGLWQKDIEQGYILPCIAYPLGDLVVDGIPLLEPGG